MNSLSSFIRTLRQPQNYAGLEINAVRSSFSRENVNICLVYPDRYEIGMSHYGLKLLYRLLNSLDKVQAQRCFLPDRESISAFENAEMKLFSLESKTPLHQFDMISISLLTELNYTNVLKVLDLAGLPLASRERDSGPLVAGGGISLAANPEPMSRFFDIIAIGDGEALFPALIPLVRDYKSGTFSREKILGKFRDLDGIYVPRLVSAKKEGQFIIPDLPAAGIRKQTIPKIDPGLGDQSVLVPFSNAVFNRLDVEIARGCPHNCRFCQAKAYYSPYRFAEAGEITEFIRDSLAKTGFDKVSFSSLSAGDYPDFSGLLKTLAPQLPPCVSLSVSSLKPSTVRDEVLQRISLIRKTGLTVVPEAGSQRLRDLIRKDLNEDQIMDAVNLALTHRWQRIKLYFMIGLPDEQQEDIEAIADLLDKICNRFCHHSRRNRISVSFAAFVPKPHSPFEREAREDADTLGARVAFLQSALKGYPQIKYNFHDLKKGEVETILARGDRRIGDLIEDAYTRGHIFSAWDGEFDTGGWDELVARYRGRVYLGKIPPEQRLPWSHIRIIAPPGDKSGKKTRDIRRNTGNQSGSTASEKGSVSGYSPVRLYYPREGDFTLLSHLTMMQYIERLIRQTGIAFKYSGGYHPRIKLTALPPLPVFSRSSEEVVEVWLDDKWEEKDILERLNRLDTGLHFHRAERWRKGHVKLSRDIRTIEYHLEFAVSAAERMDIQSLLIEKDEVRFEPDLIRLKIYHPEKGSERFAAILRIIDPHKVNSHRIWRRRVKFRHHETGNH